MPFKSIMWFSFDKSQTPLLVFMILFMIVSCRQWSEKKNSDLGSKCELIDIDSLNMKWNHWMKLGRGMENDLRHLDSAYYFFNEAYQLFIPNNCNVCSILQSGYCLSKILRKQRDHFSSLIVIELALKFHELTPCEDTLTIVDALIQKGTLLRRMGYYKLCQNPLHESLQILEIYSKKNTKQIELVYNQLLLLAMIKKDLSHYQTVEKKTKNELGSGWHNYLNFDELKGFFYYQYMGDRDSSLYYYEKLERALHGKVDCDPFWRESSYYMLNRMYQEKGEYQKAKSILKLNFEYILGERVKKFDVEPIIQIVGESNGHVELVLACQYASCLVKEYQDDRSKDKVLLLYNALSIFEAVDERLFASINWVDETSLNNFQLVYSRDYTWALAALMELMDIGERPENLKHKIFTFMDRAKALSLSRMRSNKNDLSKSNSDNWNQQIYLFKSLQKIKNDYFYGGKLLPLEEYLAYYDKIKKSKEISIKYSSYSDPMAPDKSWLDVPKHIESQLDQQNAAVIQYHETNNRIFQVITTSDTFIIDLFEGQDIAEQIHKIVSRVRHPPLPGGGDSLYDDLYAISNQLLGNYKDLLSDLSMIYFIPDGTMHNFPFDALHFGPEGKSNWESTLGASKELIHLFSLKDLPLKTRSIRRVDKIAGFSFTNIENKYNKDEVYNLSELFGAYAEIKMLQDNYPNGKYFYGTQATVENLKASSNLDYDVIHISTHAEANSAVKSQAWIYLRDSKSNIKAISALELSQLNMDVPIVVLSTCGSSDGSLIEGEGLASLAKAIYQNDKVESVIATAWDQSDNASYKLYKHFYNNLKDGLSISKALRDAKKSLINDSDSTYNHPFYWSGVCVWM